jgi:DNA-binding beta-propeller fold protein YncE
MRAFLKLASCFGLVCLCTVAAAQTCNQPAAAIATFTALPGAPFAALASADGCVIFISLSSRNPRDPGHIGVLQRNYGIVTLARDLAISGGAPSGMSLSHDGKVLAVSNQAGVALFDTARLQAGDATPLVTARDQAAGAGNAGSVYTAISSDDKLLFVSDENAAAITVYDLPKLRAGNTAAIGRIPVDIAPVGLVFSPDGRRLYTTSELLPPGSAPATCPAEGGRGGLTPQGVLSVVDVVKAAQDPAASILAKVPGGCDPVRVTLSADGTRAFVTARGQNSLLIFDTAKLVTDADHALITSVATGRSPVGVTLAAGNVFVADSNRFARPGRKGEWLTVIDPGSARVIGAVPAGLFPRELKVTADGRTLMVTNFSSGSLELIDLRRLTEVYFAEQQGLKNADDAR